MTHRNAALVALVGGAMMALGSFLPWASVRSGLGTITIAGTDGDGVFTLVVGAVVGLIALVHLDRLASVGVRGLIGLGGIVGAYVAWVDYQGVSERLADVDSDLVAATVGAGLYVLGIGSVAAVVGAIRMDSGAVVSTTAEPVAPIVGPSGWTVTKSKARVNPMYLIPLVVAIGIIAIIYVAQNP